MGCIHVGRDGWAGKASPLAEIEQISEKGVATLPSSDPAGLCIAPPSSGVFAFSERYATFSTSDAQLMHGLLLVRFLSSFLTVQTSGRGFTDLSSEIAKFLKDARAKEGAVTLFVRHTSASLTIQENADPMGLRI
jgi:Uncharacterised protein family UPF0047